MGIDSADVTRLVGPLFLTWHRRTCGIPLLTLAVQQGSRGGDGWRAWLRIGIHCTDDIKVRDVDHLREIVEAFDRLGEAMKGA